MMNPCSVVIAPHGDTWPGLSCQSNMLQPVPKQQHSRVIRYKFLCILSSHTQVDCAQSNKAASPHSKLLKALCLCSLRAAGAIKLVFTASGSGLGTAAPAELTTLMLGRWLEVKVCPVSSVSHCCRPQTKIPPPPLLLQQNIPPAICYVRSQGPGLGQSDPICTLQPHWARGGRIQTEIIASSSLWSRSAISR